MATKIGRYNIIKYSEQNLLRMKNLHRHIYALEDTDNNRLISVFNPNFPTEYILVTDTPVFLTSSLDKLNFKIFKKSFFIKDKTIT